MMGQVSFPYSAEELEAYRMTLLAEFAALAGVPLEYISFEVTEVETDAPLEGGRRRGGNKQLAPLLDERRVALLGKRNVAIERLSLRNARIELVE